MAVTLTDIELAAAIRQGAGETALEQPIAGIVARLLGVGTAIVTEYLPDGDDFIHNEGVVRIAGWLYDNDPARNRSFADVLARSGALSLMQPFRVQRALAIDGTSAGIGGAGVDEGAVNALISAALAVHAGLPSVHHDAATGVPAGNDLLTGVAYLYWETTPLNAADRNAGPRTPTAIPGNALSLAIAAGEHDFDPFPAGQANGWPVYLQPATVPDPESFSLSRVPFFSTSFTKQATNVTIGGTEYSWWALLADQNGGAYAGRIVGVDWGADTGGGAGGAAGLDESQVQALIDSSLTNYPTDSDLTTALADYVLMSALTSALADYVTNGHLTVTLGGYITTAALNTALGDYATSAALTAAVADLVSNSTLATALADYTESADITTAIADAITAHAGMPNVHHSPPTASGGGANIVAEQITTGSAGATLAASGLEVAITPSTTSKRVLIEIHGGQLQTGGSSADDYEMTLLRGTAAIAVQTKRIRNWLGPVSLTFIDSPASDAEVTYSLNWGASTASSFGATAAAPLAIKATEID